MNQNRAPIRMPAEAFTKCPACGCKSNLLQVCVDVHCLECGWDSLSAFVESGCFNKLLYEYEEQLAREESKRIYGEARDQSLAI